MRRGDRVRLRSTAGGEKAGRLSHFYSTRERPELADRAAVTVIATADPPHPRHGSSWPQQWAVDRSRLTSLELVRRT